MIVSDIDGLKFLAHTSELSWLMDEVEEKAREDLADRVAGAYRVRVICST